MKADGETESEGLPVCINKSGMDLAPIGNLCALVNENLRNCPETTCKDSQLKLELDRRIGMASCWKLSCSSCDKLDTSAVNRIQYLKRKSDASTDREERRKMIKEVSRLKMKRKKQQSNNRKINSPFVKYRTNKHKQREVMDYSVNVRAILASFYIGTGGMDIGLVNSCQGIAGGKSWEKTFYNHSPKICKGIMNVVNATLDANLKEEIDLTIQEKLEDKYSTSEIASLTRKYHAKIKTGIDEVDNVLISLSFDMGWQKKGTGHTYDSMSGHAYYIGVRGGKVIRHIVYSKKCSVCDVSVAMGEEPQQHDDCPRNYRTGSSKAMEATAALDLILELHELGVGVEFIVSDDDSTMRAHLSHIGVHKKGMLPLDVHQPTFLCDPSHRVKVMVKEVFKLALKSKAKSECEKIDALRLKKYIGCWIAKNKSLPFDELKAKRKAPIEHLFGNHEWCDSDWCFSKELDEARDQLRVINPAASDSDSSLDAVPTAATAPPRSTLPLVRVRLQSPPPPRS